MKKQWLSLIRILCVLFLSRRNGPFVNRIVYYSPENHYLYRMLDSRTVANRFIEIARSNGEQLTPMQILKLVYIAHGWCLALYNRALIGEKVQAWQFGPVIPSLYQAMREYRGDPVTDMLPARARDVFNPQESNIVEQVFDLYGDMSGPQLSRLTHAPGSPWHQVYRDGSFGAIISNDLIEDYYKRLLSKTDEDAQ